MFESFDWKLGGITLVLGAVAIMYFSKYRASCPYQSQTKNNNKASKPSNVPQHKKQFGKKSAQSGTFNPGKIISNGMSSKEEIPTVEQMGEITLKELQTFHCNNPERRCLSVFGTIFDVTSHEDKYGPEGAYKAFAGHDATLCLGSGKLDTVWLDIFVQMTDKHKETAKEWETFYRNKYATAGTLRKWKEDQDQWEKLSEEELEKLNADCIIM